MTKMKKLVSLMLAALMLVGMMSVANAEDVTTDVIVSVGVSNHSFNAYQIFDAGNQDATSDALGNVTWGTGINGVAFLAALKTDDTFKTNDTNAFADCQTAQDVADVLAGYTDNSDAAKRFAKLALANKTGEGTVISGETTQMPIGYYLIVDTTNLDENADDAKNAALLQVTKDITIAVKTGTPTVVKKVQDKNDTTGDTSWQDSADHDIGDVVSFKLTATLPKNLDYYSNYSITFHDTLSNGLEFEEETLEVYLGEQKLDASAYTVSCTDNHNITITVNDVLALNAESEGEIVVTYGATLTEAAVVGSAGNANEVYLTYSNNPDGTGEGKTPVDKVVVFTYKVVVNKTDGKDPLTGAGFTLEKQIAPASEEAEALWEKVGEEHTGEAMTQFTWSGLDDGIYRLVETTTPAGYNTIDPIVFTISAEHSETADAPTLTSLTGNVTSGMAEFMPDTSAGSLTTTIVNKSGSVLPETGGIGTTIFYAVGGLLVVLAVVLLVTKRRVGEEG